MTEAMLSILCRVITHALTPTKLMLRTRTLIEPSILEQQYSHAIRLRFRRAA